MISGSVLKRLQENIQLYDEKCDKDFLVLFSAGKNHDIDYCEISFRHYHFWHLLGFEAKQNNSLFIYCNCKNRIDVSKEINLIYGLSTFRKKDRAFLNAFDFVENAKEIRLGYANIGPEQFQLTMALGNSRGIIGYDYPKEGNKRFLIPKSCQEKKLTQVSGQVCKILFIFSKKQTEKIYTITEYELKRELSKEVISKISLPQEIIIRI